MVIESRGSDSDLRHILTGPSALLIMRLPFDAKEATSQLAQSDRRLARVIEEAGPFRLNLEKMQDPFNALLQAIVNQQLNGTAARVIHNRVKLVCNCERYIDPHSLATVSDEALRGAGLSRAKIAALRDLAARTLDGVVPTLATLRRMDDESIIERLSSIRGIGRWTVEMMLMFRLGRPDVLPVDDFGVRKGFQLAYAKKELPARAELAKHGEKWRPYRTVGSWYMWRALEMHRSRAKAEG